MTSVQTLFLNKVLGSGFRHIFFVDTVQSMSCVAKEKLVQGDLTDKVWGTLPRSKLHRTRSRGPSSLPQPWGFPTGFLRVPRVKGGRTPDSLHDHRFAPTIVGTVAKYLVQQKGTEIT